MSYKVVVLKREYYKNAWYENHNDRSTWLWFIGQVNQIDVSIFLNYFLGIKKTLAGILFHKDPNRKTFQAS